MDLCRHWFLAAARLLLPLRRLLVLLLLQWEHLLDASLLLVLMTRQEI